MKKKVMFLGVVLGGLLQTNAFAKGPAFMKNLTVEIGAGAMIAQNKSETYLTRNQVHDTVGRPFDIGGLGGTIYLYPKAHLASFGSFSFSAGIPLQIGVSTRARPVDLESNAETPSPYSIALSLPVMADLNFGACTFGLAQERNFGFFVGAGFGYCHLGANISQNGSYYNEIIDKSELPKDINSVGFRGHAGLKANISHIPLVLAGGYQSAIGDKGHGIINITLAAEL